MFGGLTFIFGVFISELLLIFTGFLLIVILYYRYYQLNQIHNSISELINIESDGLKGSNTVEEEFKEEVELFSKVQWPVFIQDPKFGVFESYEIKPGRSSTCFRVSPELAGEYSLDHIGFNISDPFNLVKREVNIPFEVKLVYYPRVFRAALIALELLYFSGFLGFGEQVSQVKGGGLEYADTRPYVEGDPVRFVNWKAFARFGKLMVKDYYLEGALRAAVIFEPDAPDSASRDQLATEFLETVMATASLDWIIDLHIAEDESFNTIPQLHPTNAVAFALKYVLKGQEKEFERYYDILSPHKQRLVKRFFEIPIIYLPPSESLEVNSEIPVRVIISSLTGDISRLISIMDYSDSFNAVIQPSTPWRFTKELEDASILLLHYEKIQKTLQSIGVPIELNFNAVYNKIHVLES